MNARMASLPMYDLPELRQATDEWWHGLAGHFRAAGVVGVPETLHRPGEGLATWLHPALLLSQSCGYPLATALRGRVRLVATPCYDLPGCDGPNYCSFVVVRRDDPIADIRALPERCCAVNLPESWSGHHALRHFLAPRGDKPAFHAVVRSGGHRQSMAMVARGEADVAAIDCVTFGLLSRHAPEAVAPLRVQWRTAPAPGLPLIAGAGLGDKELLALREGLRMALADFRLADARSALGLAGMAIMAESDYEIMGSDAGGGPLLA